MSKSTIQCSPTGQGNSLLLSYCLHAIEYLFIFPKFGIKVFVNFEEKTGYIRFILAKHSGDASKGVAHRVVMSLSLVIGEWWVVGASTTSNPRTDWCGVVPRARTEAHRSCGRFANGN